MSETPSTEGDAPQRAEALSRELEIRFPADFPNPAEFRSLYERALLATGTRVSLGKYLSRILKAQMLCQHAVHVFGTSDGAIAELGVFKGLSALLLAQFRRRLKPDFDGSGLHLFDSFEGFRAGSEEDVVAIDENGDWLTYVAPGHFATPYEGVVKALEEFPATQFHVGWVPESLAGVEEQKWAFVHLDLDLYAPTLAALEYFYPRLAEGGMIIEDDFSSKHFPGAKKAWEQFCSEASLQFSVLETGQAILKR